ncbi:hypothetical protein YC2023_050014 [Brassica napus]
MWSLKRSGEKELEKMEYLLRLMQSERIKQRCIDLPIFNELEPLLNTLLLSCLRLFAFKIIAPTSAIQPLLFISSKKIAFCSDRSIQLASPQGDHEGSLQSVNPSVQDQKSEHSVCIFISKTQDGYKKMTFPLQSIKRGTLEFTEVDDLEKRLTTALSF